MMPYSHQFGVNNKDNGFSEWCQCNCCPYGYHIDLDFVRYCESIGQEVDRTGSIKRRRDRRRQRQSMEVLLGLTPSLFAGAEKNHQTILKEEESPKPKLPVVNDALDEVFSDFERTLQRSNKLSNNLPDVTAVAEKIHRAPSTSSVSSTSGSSVTVQPTVTDGVQSFDSVGIELCGLSPAALQKIREQMALSLERTKELEEQVKVIPNLQKQLSTLQEEKHQLMLTLKAKELPKCDPYSRLRSQSFTNVNNFESEPPPPPPPPPPRRDFGVMCGVLTRNVGVGHQYPNTKSVSTATPTNDEISGDKWFSQKIKFLGQENLLTIVKGTQTPPPVEKKHSNSQTVNNHKQTCNNQTQTVVFEKCYESVGISVFPDRLDAFTEMRISTKAIGVSEDKITDEFCPKCTTKKNSVAIGPDGPVDSIPVSLANLTVPRSKSFNLGEDRLNLSSRYRTVGSQYESFNASKMSQYEPNVQSKASQHAIKFSHKNTQYEYNSAHKVTDTADLERPKRHTSSNTEEVKLPTSEVACNTTNVTDKPCKCLKKEKDDVNKKDETITPSRIPRPQIPTTPVEIRKFRRQDTYTKLSEPIEKHPETPGLSGLDLSSKCFDNEATSQFEKVKQSYKLPDVSAQNGINLSIKVEEDQLPLAETAMCHSNSQAHRQKASPSKEMQAAMKVLNDSLQKGQTKNIKNQLKNATNIIQQEWFKISSTVIADPLDVEDYLDCFEDISCDLLRYIVNMIDASGNTAMHYAVSHGNFDVVSILLDSKVCDINQSNKAGYTSVMLVSLADVRSPTHANVIRRLFQLADVNVRAKQHGQTALMLAVSHGRLDMVQLLLQAGADINIPDEDGSTALMCAAEHGHIDIVKHFLSQPDCDSSIADVDGSTALKIAMEAGHRHIGVLLYAHERNLHSGSGLKHKKKSSSSPKTPSSPLLPTRSTNRALAETKNK